MGEDSPWTPSRRRCSRRKYRRLSYGSRDPCPGGRAAGTKPNTEGLLKKRPWGDGLCVLVPFQNLPSITHPGVRPRKQNRSLGSLDLTHATQIGRGLRASSWIHRLSSVF